MKGSSRWDAVPGPAVHSAIVLRNGTRYVGHVVKVDMPYVRPEERPIMFSEGSRQIVIDFDEIAAIETFGGEYGSPTVCEVCRDKGNE